MALEKIIMRDVVPEVDTAYPGAGGPSGTPVWATIGGVTSVSHSPSKSDADTTTRDDAGRESHLPSRRGDSFTFACKTIEDPGTGARDAGQDQLETLGTSVGTAGIGYFRLTTPGGTTYSFLGSVQAKPFDGSEDAAADASYDVTVTGSITKA